MRTGRVKALGGANEAVRVWLSAAERDQREATSPRRMLVGTCVGATDRIGADDFHTRTARSLTDSLERRGERAERRQKRPLYREPPPGTAPALGECHDHGPLRSRRRNLSSQAHRGGRLRDSDGNPDRPGTARRIRGREAGWVALVDLKGTGRIAPVMCRNVLEVGGRKDRA